MTHNWPRFRGQETMEFSAPCGDFLSLPLLLRFRDHCGRGRRKNVRTRGTGWLLDTTGQRQPCIHSSRDSVHKTCASSSWHVPSTERGSGREVHPSRTAGVSPCSVDEESRTYCARRVTTENTTLCSFFFCRFRVSSQTIGQCYGVSSSLSLLTLMLLVSRTPSLHDFLR